TEEWTRPSDSADNWHDLFAATSNVHNRKGEELVTAYAVHRPDGLWSLLLINKDPNHSYKVRTIFRNESSRTVSEFSGPVDVYQYSREQYQLNSDKDDPAPIKS